MGIECQPSVALLQLVHVDALCHWLTNSYPCLPAGDSGEQSNHGYLARVDHLILIFPCPVLILKVDPITTADEGAVVV